MMIRFTEIYLIKKDMKCFVHKKILLKNIFIRKLMKLDPKACGLTVYL